MLKTSPTTSSASAASPARRARGPGTGAGGAPAGGCDLGRRGRVRLGAPARRPGRRPAASTAASTRGCRARIGPRPRRAQRLDEHPRRPQRRRAVREERSTDRRARPATGGRRSRTPRARWRAPRRTARSRPSQSPDPGSGSRRRPPSRTIPTRRGDDHQRVTRLVREHADHAQDRAARRLREPEHGLGELREAQRDRTERDQDQRVAEAAALAFDPRHRRARRDQDLAQTTDEAQRHAIRSSTRFTRIAAAS